MMLGHTQVWDLLVKEDCFWPMISESQGQGWGVLWLSPEYSFQLGGDFASELAGGLFLSSDAKAPALETLIPKAG